MSLTGWRLTGFSEAIFGLVVSNMFDVQAYLADNLI